MTHKRRAIRDAVVALLTGAATAAGARVYDHPFNARKDFPALVVEDLGANFSEGNLSEVQQRLDISGAIHRTYRFVVIAEVQQSDNAARDRDDLLEEVEVAIAGASLAGVKSITVAGYQASDGNAGDKPIRRGIQVFEAVYITPQGDPSATL